MTRGPALAAILVAAAAAIVGAVLLLGTRTRDESRRTDAAGPTRIREKGARDQPAVQLDPDLAALVDPDAPQPPRLEVEGAPAAPEEDRAIVSVFDEAIAEVRLERMAHDPAYRAAHHPHPHTSTSDPSQIDVTGMMPRPLPPVDPNAGAPVVAGEPDPFKPPPPNSGAATKPPPTDPQVVESGLPKAIITRVIRRSMDPIRACYEHELARHPGLEGILQVTFTIDRDGSVASAIGTGFDTAVATCVAGVIRGLTFPAPDGGGTVTVRYPFPFRPTV